MFTQESVEKLNQMKGLSPNQHSYVSYNAKNNKACLKLYFSNIDIYSLCSELTSNGFWHMITPEEDNQTCFNLNITDKQNLDTLYEIINKYAVKRRPIFH